MQSFWYCYIYIRVGKHLESMLSPRKDDWYEEVSSIKIQSLKWHDKVRTNAFLISVQCFSSRKVTFSFFSFFYSTDGNLCLGEHVKSIVQHSIRTNRLLVLIPYFVCVIRLHSDKDYPIYIIRKKITNNANYW